MGPVLSLSDSGGVKPKVDDEGAMYDADTQYPADVAKYGEEHKAPGGTTDGSKESPAVPFCAEAAQATSECGTGDEGKHIVEGQ